MIPRRQQLSTTMLALLVLACACGSDSRAGSDGGQAGESPGSVPTGDAAVPADGPVWPGETWEVVDPEVVGLDAARIEDARTYAFAAGRNTQGVVIVRHGRIAAEWYVEGRDEGSLATSWSMAKSFASTLIGIAIDRGELSSVDVPMTDFIPAWLGTDKADIRLEDVLRMQTGIPWMESTDNIPLHLTPEQLTYSIERVGATGPGVAFNYSSADTMLLSAVIEAVAGTSAGEYAQEQLFRPIGMSAEWWQDADGHTMTYCCIDAPTREYARFGWLFAREGDWDGESVVSASWVGEATAPAENAAFYGYQWWLNEDGTIYPDAPTRIYGARGLHGQFLYVMPDVDLVVVRNSLYVRAGDGPLVANGSFRIQTQAPDEWDDAAFLAPILDALTD